MTTPDKNQLTLTELKEIKNRYLTLFQQWAKEVPAFLFTEMASSHKTYRKEICEFLALRWEKLHQDINGALFLLHTNHIGPATVLSRVVRENVLWMVACAFDKPENDIANLHYLVDIKEKENAAKLKRDCEAFEDINESNTVIQKLLEGSLKYAKETADKNDEYPTTEISELADKGFRRLAQYNMQRFKEAGIEPEMLVAYVLDYWAECEAVHTGPNAICHYRPTNYLKDSEINTELAIMFRIKDLYPTKALVTASLVTVGDLRGKIEIPPVATQLGRIAKVAEELVVSTVQSSE